MTPLKALCPTKRAGTFFGVALMADKTLLRVEHILQSFEATVLDAWVFILKHYWSGLEEESLVPLLAWSPGNSAEGIFRIFTMTETFLRFQVGSEMSVSHTVLYSITQWLCKSKRSILKNREEEKFRHYWDGHSIKASSKDRSKRMSMPKCSAALIFMLLIAIIFPWTICICHKYLIYSPSFICT